MLGKSELKNGKLGSPSPLAQPSKLVYIIYQDHVLFRHSDPNLYEPSVRECVGWIEKEDERAIWLVCERSVKPLPFEKTTLKESGFVILKANIIELREGQLDSFKNVVAVATMPSMRFRTRSEKLGSLNKGERLRQ